jgi:hypothetical protein
MRLVGRLLVVVSIVVLVLTVFDRYPQVSASFASGSDDER